MNKDDLVKVKRAPTPIRKEKKVHAAQDSLFTSSSGFANYRGLFNLAMILLVVSHSRLALENIIKYGILVDPVQWIKFFLKDPYHWPCTCLFLASNIYILFAYAVEKGIYKKHISENFGIALHSLNLITVLMFPAGVVLLVKPNPIAAVVTLMLYTSVFMKLVSYAAVNNWCREALRDHIPIEKVLKEHEHEEEGDTKTDAPLENDVPQAKVGKGWGKGVTVHRTSTVADAKKETYTYTDDKDLKIVYGGKPIVYPENLTLKNLYYFILVPTFCYELNFPKTQRIRKIFLFKRLMEMIFLFQLMLGLIQQWIIPTINNAMAPFSSMDYPRLFERLLKLAIPNHLIWLIFFYWLFHSSFNAMAEIMHFADRNFYNDWWNAETVNEFWQSWNIPVHRWCSRHLYFPLLDKGVSKLQASVAVFLVSAFFHEYLVSVPLNMFRLWAFSGMIMQVPLAYLVSKYLKGQWGNILVWLSLILGQPICILMYFHDYYVENMAPVTRQLRH